MAVTNPDWRSILVPVFLAAQVLLVHRAASGEHPPQPPVRVRFPSAFGPWRLFRQDPLDAVVATRLSAGCADCLVSQTYFEPASSSFASLLVAWFPTQREGLRQPPSPKVCLPGNGWTPRIADELTVDTRAGAITVNRYVVDRGQRRAVVLYWYQTPRRVIASEWAAKFWVLADAWRDKRTDTALIRVIAWPSGEGDDAATAVATGFARHLYPLLRAYLPQ